MLEKYKGRQTKKLRKIIPIQRIKKITLISKLKSIMIVKLIKMKEKKIKGDEAEYEEKRSDKRKATEVLPRKGLRKAKKFSK